MPGNANPADALTKHVAPKSVFREYMSRIYQVDAARFTALRREQPEPPPSPPCSPPCSPPSSPAGTRPPTPTPPASPIKCVDAENNLVAIMAPAALLEQQDFAHALMLLASQPPQLPRPLPTPCLKEAVSGASKKQSCAALSTCTAEVMPAPAELAPASMAPPMLGPGYPSDVAGDGPISACCGERWTECDGCGWVVCPLCLNVDLFELVEDTGGRVRRERTAGCAHQYRISRCSWLVTGTDGQGRRLPVCGCHREYLKLEDSDGD